MDCDLCQMVQRDQGSHACRGLAWAGRCPQGHIPDLPPACHEVWALFLQAMPGLCRPDGGYDLGALQVVLTMNQISPDAQQNILSTFLALVAVCAAARRQAMERQ